MNISVIFVTVRMGGMDLLVHGLNAQTYPQDSFEVILVDGMFRERKELSSRLPRNFIHIPIPETRRYYDASYAHNVALRHANGELIIFLNDYIWPDKNFLAEHWRIYKEFPGYSAVGHVDRFYFPPISPLVHKTTLTDSDWGQVGWSAFVDEFTQDYAERFFSEQTPFYEERRGGYQGAQVGESGYCELAGKLWYAALNESLPMAVLRRLNGWDERYDGEYGVADIDIGIRANNLGWRFLILPELINRTLGNHATSATIPGRYKDADKRADRMPNAQLADEAVRNRTVRVEEGAWL